MFVKNTIKMVRQRIPHRNMMDDFGKYLRDISNSKKIKVQHLIMFKWMEGLLFNDLLYKMSLVIL